MRAQLDEPYRTMRPGKSGISPGTPPFTRMRILPLSIALNQINRSTEKGDLYPFVLPGVVIDKLEFVHGLRG